MSPDIIYSFDQILRFGVSLLWIVVAIIAAKKLGGKGAWLFLAACILEIFMQIALWGASFYFGPTHLGSWRYVFLASGSLGVSVMKVAGILCVILQASGWKLRARELELVNRSSHS